MTMVIDNLYIGEAKDVDLKQLDIQGFTRVLSVCPGDFADRLPKRIIKNGNHLQYAIFDTESERIMRYFDPCCEFIKEGLAQGKVLVHCQAGVSRSAAIIMVYLMKSQNLTPKEAFKILRSARKSACPNAGFRDQIKLYAAMGNEIDPTFDEYRLYTLANQADDALSGKVVPADWAKDPANGLPAGTKLLLRCKRCRRTLMTESNLLYHSSGEGQMSFRYRKRDDKVGAISTALCASYFTEPLDWMTEVTDGELQGKLNCPKCDARLGSFNWAGEQCSCGAWITPSFKVHRKGVDDMTLQSSFSHISKPQTSTTQRAMQPPQGFEKEEQPTSTCSDSEKQEPTSDSTSDATTSARISELKINGNDSLEVNGDTVSEE